MFHLRQRTYIKEQLLVALDLDVFLKLTYELTQEYKPLQIQAKVYNYCVMCYRYDAAIIQFISCLPINFLVCCVPCYYFKFSMSYSIIENEAKSVGCILLASRTKQIDKKDFVKQYTVMNSIFELATHVPTFLNQYLRDDIKQNTITNIILKLFIKIKYHNKPLLVIAIMPIIMITISIRDQTTEYYIDNSVLNFIVFHE